MIAAAVALAAELAMPSSGGVFGWAATSDLAAQLAALGTFMLCCSGGNQGGHVVKWERFLQASPRGDEVAPPCAMACGPKRNVRRPLHFCRLASPVFQPRRAQPLNRNLPPHNHPLLQPPLQSA